MVLKAQIRLAVAQEVVDDMPAARLGRAVKFALFDIAGNELRGPFYRVRHDEPGEVCDDHAELAALLYDCRAVIAGGVGPHMLERLRDRGIEVVATPERRPAAQLAARYLAGTLERIVP